MKVLVGKQKRERERQAGLSCRGKLMVSWGKTVFSSYLVYLELPREVNGSGHRCVCLCHSTTEILCTGFWLAVSFPPHGQVRTPSDRPLQAQSTDKIDIKLFSLLMQIACLFTQKAKPAESGIHSENHKINTFMQCRSRLN